MLCLLFSVGNRRFCIEAKKVLRVLDKVSVEAIGEAPDFVKGVIQFEQQWMPVLDLCELVTHQSCLNNMSTRMILIEYPLNEVTLARVALIAESVDDTVDLDPEHFKKTGLTLKDHQFIGDIAIDDANPVQILKPENLLNKAALEVLTPRLLQSTEATD